MRSDVWHATCILEMRAHRTLRYGLSYRRLEELLAERGMEVDHVT